MRRHEDITPRLVPLAEAIVEQGVAEGAFNVDDKRAAAWFVLPTATEFAPPALGYQGPCP